MRGDATTSTLLVRGTPPEPAVGLIIAFFCGLLSAYHLACVFSPFLREYVRWGRNGRVRKVSPVGCLAWAVACAAFGVVFCCEAIRYTPVTSKAFWIVCVAFAVVLVAAIRDGLFNWRR